MSACIIRTLLYEHSEIDAIPELNVKKGGSRRGQNEDNSDASSFSSYNEENEASDSRTAGTVQPDWENISKDLSLADPDQVIACDVYIFQKIAKRMPQEQLMALLRGVREHALATKDETKFRQLASVMPASSLLHLLQELSDTVRRDRHVQRLAVGDSEVGDDDNEDNDETTNHSDDSTIHSNESEGDESENFYDCHQHVAPDPAARKTDNVRPAQTSQSELLASRPSNRHVTFSETNNVRRIEPLEKSPELWWEKQEMKKIRGQCAELVEQYAYAENDWEYLETIGRILNDPEASSTQLTADLAILANHDVCRGLERHIVDELHDLGHMHRMNVLHSQNDLQNETGSTDPLAYWDTLAEAASETSVLGEVFAMKLARFDRTQVDAIPVLVD